MTRDPAATKRHIPLDRVSVLIDSIYAFAMTLLVISVDMPSKYENAEVAPVQGIIISILPDLIHFFIAFVLLAIFWYFEHQRFRSLRFLDRPLLCMNIASLAFVCLLPFSTNMAGDYPFDYLGAILFELNIFVVGMIALLQWIHIRGRSTDMVPDMSSSQISREILWSTVFPALSVMGVVIALIQIPWSICIYLLAPLVMAFLFSKDPVPG